ncbi:MAG: hypothetical protein Kow0090_12550 [Myxococcota bacterium]
MAVAPNKERILVLEPEPKFLIKYVKALDEAKIPVLAASSTREALSICAEELPKAAILHVPNRNEFMAIRRFFRRKIPYIRIGSPTEQDTGISQVSPSDGEHLIGHPADPNQLILVARLLGELSELRFSGEKKATSDPGTIRDPVTRFYPFQTFKPLLAQEIKRAQRYKYPLSLLLVSFDDFENAVSRLPPSEVRVFTGGLALAISQTIREVDWPVEYGLGKVLLLFPHTDLQGLNVVAGRVSKTVSEAFYENGPISLTVTASIGGAHYDGAGGINFTEMIKIATDNLLKAQKLGGNRTFI